MGAIKGGTSAKMAPKRPPLLARPFYYAARKGWIRFDQYSPYKRFVTVLQIFWYGLWKVLRRLSPRPFRALFAILLGRDRFLLRVVDSPAPISLGVSPMNFISLLHLARAGYYPLSAEPATGTILMPLAEGLTLALRACGSGDVSILKELLVDQDYGSDFQGYKIIDVGAHIGGTALFFCVHGAEKVVAVEPAPDNVGLAQENILRSPYADRITLLPVAIAASDGEMPLHLAEGNPQMHALLPTPNNRAYFASEKVVMVPVWSFKRLIEHVGWLEVDLVKLDCEGAEYAILLETEDTILRRVKRWVIEYHAAPEPLEERLRRLGYQVRRTKDMIMSGILYASYKGD